MRNLFVKASAVLASALVAGAAMADTTPATSAVTLAQGVDLSDAKSAGLIIVGLMIGVGVVLWGARLVMSHFKPKI